MKRFHLFEFEDQSWFPKPIREGMTDYLQFVSNAFNIYKPVIPLINKGMEKSSQNRIIDLCSGGGGGILSVNKELKEVADQPFTVLLTDKYPNIPAFERASRLGGDNVLFSSAPVDAMHVPGNLRGFRTLFLSFHHFKPEDARKILQDAVKAGDPIGIFEGTERNVKSIIPMLFSPLFVLLLTPFIRPVRLSRIVFTYLIPLIPLFTVWDGVVSVLRTYSVKELEQMTKEIDAPDYTWEAGTKKAKGGVVTYLLGVPGKSGY